MPMAAPNPRIHWVSSIDPWTEAIRMGHSCPASCLSIQTNASALVADITPRKPRVTELNDHEKPRTHTELGRQGYNNSDSRPAARLQRSMQDAKHASKLLFPHRNNGQRDLEAKPRKIRMKKLTTTTSKSSSCNLLHYLRPI